MYLFGFGSLINIKSAQKSFGRILKQEDLIPVEIKGFERVWNAQESIKFDNIPTNGVFLNIRKNPNESIWGTIIKIDDEELEILKIREKNYSCITIDSSDVLNSNLKENIIAFMTTNEEKIAKKDDENSFIPAKYIDILNEGLEKYDENFVNNFKKCLKNMPFKLKEGIYTFSDPAQHKAATQGKANSEAK